MVLTINMCNLFRWNQLLMLFFPCWIALSYYIKLQQLQCTRRSCTWWSCYFVHRGLWYPWRGWQRTNGLWSISCCYQCLYKAWEVNTCNLNYWHLIAKYSSRIVIRILQLVRFRVDRKQLYFKLFLVSPVKMIRQF